MVVLLKVPERAVMDVMGWSSSAMVERYQHITALVRIDIAKRVGGLLWQEPKKKSKKAKGKSKSQAGKKSRRPDEGTAG